MTGRDDSESGAGVARPVLSSKVEIVESMDSRR